VADDGDDSLPDQILHRRPGGDGVLFVVAHEQLDRATADAAARVDLGDGELDPVPA
jgi:hypothetical protein